MPKGPPVWAMESLVPWMQAAPTSVPEQVSSMIKLLSTGIAWEFWGSDGTSGKMAAGVSSDLSWAGYPFVAQAYASHGVKRARWGGDLWLFGSLSSGVFLPLFPLFSHLISLAMELLIFQVSKRRLPCQGLALRYSCLPSVHGVAHCLSMWIINKKEDWSKEINKGSVKRSVACAVVNGLNRQNNSLNWRLVFTSVFVKIRLAL